MCVCHCLAPGREAFSSVCVSVYGGGGSLAVTQLCPDQTNTSSFSDRQSPTPSLGEEEPYLCCVRKSGTQMKRLGHFGACVV